MVKVDVLGEGSSTIILDSNDYTVSCVLVRSDVSIIDSIKIAKKTVEDYIKDIEDDYEGVLNYEVNGVKKGNKYLIVDRSKNKEHVFRDEKSNETDGISELLWIVDIEVEEV